MREFTKSMVSYGWAMSMFGVQQMLNLLTPQNGDFTKKATDAFNNVSGAAADELGANLQGLFRAGDRMQAGMVDLFMGGLGMAGADPNCLMSMGSNMMRQSMNMGQQPMCGSRPAMNGAQRSAQAAADMASASNPVNAAMQDPRFAEAQDPRSAAPPQSGSQHRGWGPPK